MHDPLIAGGTLVFLYDLTEEERSAFPTLARAVIHADQRLCSHEHDYLERLQRELIVEAEQLSFDQALAAFRTPAARRAAYCELLAIAWIDEGFADEEAVLLERIAGEWRLSPDDQVAIHQWVHEQTAHVARARQLFVAAG